MVDEILIDCITVKIILIHLNISYKNETVGGYSGKNVLGRFFKFCFTAYENAFAFVFSGDVSVYGNGRVINKVAFVSLWYFGAGLDKQYYRKYTEEKRQLRQFVFTLHFFPLL
ncbi:MAG: hypothetical protein IKN56_04465 [Clostridia bacterium]|nr:hypothetical protein [Clostridia bacterium]